MNFYWTLEMRLDHFLSNILFTSIFIVKGELIDH